MQPKIQFLASLPAIQSALSIQGNGDGARVKLDIPGTHVADALRLVMYTSTVFRVTIEPADPE